MQLNAQGQHMVATQPELEAEIWISAVYALKRTTFQSGKIKNKFSVTDPPTVTVTTTHSIH